MQDYRKLHVWERPHDHAIGVRKTRRFPRSGYGSLTSQMTSAAESIAFNIVEGCGSRSQKEFVRFLDISIKSSFELEYQLKLATDYEVLGSEAWSTLSNETIEIRKMLCGLSAKVQESTEARSVGRLSVGRLSVGKRSTGNSSKGGRSLKN